MAYLLIVRAAEGRFIIAYPAGTPDEVDARHRELTATYPPPGYVIRIVAQ